MSYSDWSKALQEEILHSPAYRLAYEDIDLLADDDLRPVRLQLELLKPERALHEHGINSTVVVFGSARTLPLQEARLRLEQAEQACVADPDNEAAQKALNVALRQHRQAGYYEQAREFATLVSKRFQQEKRRDFVVVTGGGPGIMEAANLGAYEAGARSIGLNITLPREQKPNPFITPELAFRFHYFAIRKMHFLMRAKALVAFPGGFGTFDELFEALTLIQTRKMQRVPVVLFGAEFWQRAVDFEFLISEGVIAPRDRDLFAFVETAEQAVQVLHDFYQGKPPE
ncbi:LOG family protein [Profundibacter amoris]|uniref:Cytokinin riboside 5'-monophosphate phosphoribohydrolase n=1 Tax=Profundibacter amoris TaxID=2171755 RepID=A0A347UCP0_9RHOB|nr:TIGR00730 family Rossman fold protein [Profundibacter amoris]AXX96618.1 TIGR00730 family Rossman fold protein [Profundibacter amoris]